MFKPQPKPVKKDKKKMTSWEFRKKYNSNKGLTRKTSKVKKLTRSKVKSLGNKIRKKSKRKADFYSLTAWKWFSRYIKALHCNPESGVVRCATSGKLMHIADKQCQAGHCIKVRDANGSNYATAFDERNCMPQSLKDNFYNGGRPEIMRDKIDEYWGDGTFQELVIKAKQPVFLTKADFDVIAKEYKEKTYKVVEEKKLGKFWLKKNR